MSLSFRPKYGFSFVNILILHERSSMPDKKNPRFYFQLLKLAPYCFASAAFYSGRSTHSHHYCGRSTHYPKY